MFSPDKQKHKTHEEWIQGQKTKTEAQRRENQEHGRSNVTELGIRNPFLLCEFINQFLIG